MRVAAIAVLLTLFAVPVADAAPITVPLDIGVGPAAHWFTGLVGQDQLAHTGIRLSLEAVADHAMIMQHIKRVPPKYRKMAAQMDEFRYRPSLFIPDTIIISPKVAHTGMYGATWRLLPLMFNLFPDRTTRLDLDVSLLMTYAFIHSDTLPSQYMNFLRPGVDVGFEWTVPVLTDAFLISLGYASQFYLPQAVGGDVFEWAEDRPSIWHVSQIFMVFHWRVPYEANL